MRKRSQVPDLFTPDGFVLAQMIVPRAAEGRRQRRQDDQLRSRAGSSSPRRASRRSGRRITRCCSRCSACSSSQKNGQLVREGARHRDAVPDGAADRADEGLGKRPTQRVSASPILATRDLGLDIGGATIVADVGLEVGEGELLGIIGPNGAGKTSLFNLLSGLTRPTSGTRPPGRRRHHGRAAVPARPRRARPHVPGVERVPAAVGARERPARGGGGARRDDAHLAAADRVREPPSSGRTGRSAASASRHAARCPRACSRTATSASSSSRWCSPATPRVILLDEPMAGVSIENVPELVELIRSVHAEEGKTVLMVEHHIEVVTGLAQRIAVHAPRGTARLRHAGRRSWRTRRCSRPTSGGADADRRSLEVRDLHVHLGAVARPAGRSSSTSPRAASPRCSAATASARRRRCARCSGLVDRARPRAARRRGASRACRRTGSSAAASATSPRTATSSPA